jgi:hypothetical protein
MQQQKARSGGMSPTEIAEKEELAQARAVKRAERVEARRADAEKHKETVCPHFHSCRSTQSDVLPPSDEESHGRVFRVMFTSVRVIIAKPSRSTMPLSKSTVLVPRTCQTWPQHG